MFVDLMNDIYNTFSERFLKVQLVFEQPTAPSPIEVVPQPAPQKATKRYNAMGILEDVPSEEPSGTDAALDVGPTETPAAAPTQTPPVAARKDPTIVGAGSTRSFNNTGGGAPADWSNVGRNDPCPCGSGKKFKKCHGASL